MVRALQEKVTAHVEEWKKAGGLQRPRTEEELQDLAQVLFEVELHNGSPMCDYLYVACVAEHLFDTCSYVKQQAKKRFAEFETALASSRKDFVARAQLRQETAACYMALRRCHGLQMLETDTDLEACAKGHRYVEGVNDKEYAALVESAAKMEHDQLLKALATTNAGQAKKAVRVA